MSAPVALVLVSHVRELADGAVRLAAQMAPGVAILAAGGLEDGSIGTSYDAVEAALAQATADGGSAVVLTDLGSAVLTTESVLELADEDLAARVRIADAPFVEGA
ncbi:dihydroxyacetone kinase phosphoryl donor subunit DhaM, partial [Cellulomonas massiliensis]|uniref:dihydroxyacetone kinase phosphoryl donor subunit DhaM n=1 Tax=Cellulomonas massiliensis TaxID=1465811 RepID=UPI000474DA0F